ncbi:MAG: glycoside hydrolase family 95 protein, partial [Lentisphaerae bacterium]
MNLGQKPNLKRKHEMILHTPAVDWRDGIPLGNGHIGAVHYGNVYKDRVLINHERLWSPGLSPAEYPDVSQHLPKLRELLKEGRYEEANTFLPDLLRKGNQFREPRFQPLGDLFIELKFNDANRNYCRRLDMATGEAVTSWQDGDAIWRKKIFVSRPRNVIVMCIECSQSGMIEATIELGLHPIEDVAFATKTFAEIGIEGETHADTPFLR